MKKRRSDLSAKERQDYFNFNKKYYLKENIQNSLNLKKKHKYSPSLENKERKNSLKINNNNYNNNLNSHDNSIQKIKKKISNINTISSNSNNLLLNTNSNLNSNFVNYSQTQINKIHLEENLFEYFNEKIPELTKDEKT